MQPIEKLRAVKKLWKKCERQMENDVKVRTGVSPQAIKEVGGLIFFVPGTPMWRRSGIKQTFKNQDARKFEDEVGWAAVSAARANGGDWQARNIPMRAGVILGIVVYRKKPAQQKPDLSNYLKLVEDALTMAHIYGDDAQITGYFPGTRKEESETEGIRVTLVPQTAMAQLGFGDLHGI